MTAKKIRTTEAQLESELRKLGKSAATDLRKISINPNRIATRSPSRWPAARRAQSHQQSLRSHYQRWATLVEKHLAQRESAASNSDTAASTNPDPQETDQ